MARTCALSESCLLRKSLLPRSAILFGLQTALAAAPAMPPKLAARLWSKRVLWFCRMGASHQLPKIPVRLYWLLAIALTLIP